MPRLTGPLTGQLADADAAGAPATDAGATDTEQSQTA
jgi:hypothetical protein